MHDASGTSVLVMIVDDQLEDEQGKIIRKNIYIEWFKKVSDLYTGKWMFDVRYCGTIDEVAKINVGPHQAFLAVIDLVLEGKSWSPRAVSMLDERLINEKWPLLLLSARFDSAEALERANRLVSKRGDSFFLQFLPWSTIARAVDGVEWKEVAFIIGTLISNSRGQDLRFQKSASESIEFLHITDPHFGEASWDQGSLITLRVARKRLGLGPADFVAITGDVTSTGNPKEYRLALDYLNSLASNRIIESAETGIPKDRFFLCPGNHDFSRSLALSANISSAHPYMVEASVQECNAWSRGYAWAPYLDFEREITGNAKSWFPEPGYRINNRFSSSGLIVLELNVERFDIIGYQLGISEEDLQRRINSAVADTSLVRRSGELLIVLAHRHESNLWEGLAQVVQSSLMGLASEGPLIYLCGHHHSAEVVPGMKDRVLFVRGIPPNDGPSLPRKTLPMLHSVVINRDRGEIKGVTVHQFSQSLNGWQFDSDGPQQYEYINGKWRAV